MDYFIIGLYLLLIIYNCYWLSKIKKDYDTTGYKYEGGYKTAFMIVAIVFSTVHIIIGSFFTWALIQHIRETF